MAFGLVVLAIGIAIFASSRFAAGGPAGTQTPASSATLVVPSTSPVEARPSGTEPATSSPEPTPAPTAGPTLEQLVGQKLVVAMDGSTPSKSLLARVRRGEIAGVVLFGFQIESEQQLRATADSLQEAASAGGQPPLLVMVDQEGGAIRRLPWAEPRWSATRMGRSKDPDVVRGLGAAAGQALRDAGVNVDLAPVADVPGDAPSFMRDMLRTFSSDPEIVGSLVVAFADGLASQDIVATVKHFPGIGRVERNTDRYVEVVRASRDDLDRDLGPFRSAIDAGVPIVMLSNVTYTALDPDNAAGWSRSIANDLLRDDLGFDGVTITDSLSGAATARGVSARSLAARAARAGIDLVMLTGDEASTAKAYATLLERASTGWLDRGDLEASYRRILDLKATIRP